MHANYTSKESIRQQAIQARYGTKAKEMIETLQAKTVPTSLINAIPPPPFLETIYLKKHLQKKKKKSVS